MLRLVSFTFVTFLLCCPQLRAQGDGPMEEGLQRENENEPVEQGGPTPAGPVGLPPDQERTGLLALFPEAYGTFELRYAIWREMRDDRGLIRLTRGPILLDNSRQVSDAPHWELRPTVGSTFLNGAIDSSFTYVFINNVGSSELRKYDVINYTQWTLVDGKFNDHSPYNFALSAFTDLMNGDQNGGSFSYSDLGFTTEANFQLPVPTGELTLRAYLNPSIEIYSHEQSEKNRAPLTRSDAPEALEVPSNPRIDESVPDAPATVKQTHPLYLAFYGVGATYRPHALRTLTLGLSFDVIQDWRPTYRESFEPGDTETTVGLASYHPEAVSYGRLTCTYELSKRVTLVNVLRHYAGGVFQRGLNSDHPDETHQAGSLSWENRLSLVVTLF